MATEPWKCLSSFYIHRIRPLLRWYYVLITTCNIFIIHTCSQDFSRGFNKLVMRHGIVAWGVKIWILIVHNMDLNCSNSTTISTLTVITQSKSALIAVLEMKIWIYWSESNSLIYLIFLIKLKNLLVWTKFYWSWAGGPVDIVRTAYSSALFSGRGYINAFQRTPIRLRVC
jgi:hypothetical protein